MTNPQPKTQTAQISCVNKSDRPNPHERIVNIGGSSPQQWKISQQTAIQLIEDGQWRFYTSVGGKSVWVVVAVSRYGYKYLRTESDNEQTNNLLSLPECP